MSTEQLLDGSASQTPLVTDHNPEGNTDSRVYVNGTRIPVATVDIHIRKEGPLDVTRYAEVEFPAEYEDQPYIELFEGVEPDNQSDFDELYIELKAPSGSSNNAITTQGIIENNDTDEEWIPTFRGFVTGVGSTGSNGIWQCRAQGAGQLLGNITADRQFTRTGSATVFRYLVDRADEKLPFPVSLTELPSGRDVGSEAVFDTDETIDDGGGFNELFEQFLSENQPLNGSAVGGEILQQLFADDTLEGIYTSQVSPQTFQPNRHTLRDVATWLRSKTGTRFWFEPTTEGVTLVPLRNPLVQEFQAHYLGGDVEVITNNALSELAPINTLTAKGSASSSLFNVGDFEVNLPNSEGTYYVAKARHTGLYKRVGEVELAADTFINSDGDTAEQVGEDAKDGLKAQIDNATAGDMVTMLHGGVVPFDTIEAQPTCATNNVEDTTPITYEVSRVHHIVNPDDGVSRTEMNVGIHTDIEDDIEIVNTWERGS